MAKSVEDYIVDFSKEESGGGGARYKEGTYPGRIISAKPTVSSKQGTPGLELKVKFTDGRVKGKTLTERLWVTPKSLGRIRSLLEACDKKVPKKVNLSKIAAAVKGEELYFEIIDDDSGKKDGYKTKSVVAFDGFIHPDDYDPDAVDDDEDEDDDFEEEDEDEDLEDEEDDEDEEEEEEPPKRSRPKAKSKTTRRRKAKVEEEEEEEEDEDDDDDDDEDEEPPKRRRRAAKSKAKAKPKKRSRKRKDDDDEDEDDDDDDDLDELDLDEF